jgi:DNA repair exonuclease SbcCD nuclease subunit
MRAVVVSDLHLDHVSSGISRFEEVEAAVQRTVEVAIERDVDAWIFLGDAMDPDSGSCVFRCLDVLVRAVARLRRNSIRSILIAGNHDVISDGRSETTLSPLRSIDDVDVVESPTLFNAGCRKRLDVDVLALPYAAPHREYDAARVVERETMGDSPLLVLSHLYVRGAQPGSEASELARGRDKWLPDEELARVAARRPTTVLNGHHHRAQRHVTPSGLQVRIVGSSAILTFGEQLNQPSFLVVEI